LADLAQGWWHYAVALEPSVTVQRNFYSLCNATSLVRMVLETIQRVKKEKQDSKAKETATATTEL
jgi:hypothetical protein